MNTSFRNTRRIVAAVTTFAAGVIFATGMHWIPLAGAQSRNGSAFTPPSARAEVPLDFSAVAARVTPAVVSITAEHDAKPVARQRGGAQQQQIPPEFEQFFEGTPGMPPNMQRNQSPQQRDETAGGSGFIVSKDGYILTNNHVVDGADRVTVGLTDRRTFKARVIGTDPQTDVAVLKIDGNDFPTISLGDDNKAKVGEWVLAVGNPLQLNFTVTAGIISAKGRSNELRDLNTNKYAIQDFIQTDAAINPGNSGGPLVDTHGDVIGINSAIASPTGYYSGYGFAIPISLAKTVMDDLIAHGHVRRAILGAMIADVTQADAAVAKLAKVEGVKIEDFQPADDSPAKRAGMEPGDIIVTADGTPIDRASTLQRLIRNHQPGDVLSLEAVRYGDHKTFKVRLAEAPGDAAAVQTASAARDDATDDTGAVTSNKLGITFEPLSSNATGAANMPSSLHGVLIDKVQRGGASEGQLTPGDVITGEIFPGPKTDIRSVADFQRALAKLSTGQYIGLVVSRQIDAQGGRSSAVINLKIGG